MPWLTIQGAGPEASRAATAELRAVGEKRVGGGVYFQCCAVRKLTGF